MAAIDGENIIPRYNLFTIAGSDKDLLLAVVFVDIVV
jgi:hypothetical protein